MTIENVSRRTALFNGDGTTTVFHFAFKIFNANEADVVVTSVLTGTYSLTYGVDFTVTMNADQDTNPGGYITLSAPLASVFTLQIKSAVPYTQLVKLNNAGGFYPAVFNNALDKAIILIQQAIDVFLHPEDLPGYIDSAAGLKTDLASVGVNKGASLVGFKQPDIGAIDSTANEKLLAFVDVNEFDTLAHAKTAALMRLLLDVESGRISMFSSASPVFNEASGVLARALAFDNNTSVTNIPDGKQLNFIGIRESGGTNNAFVIGNGSIVTGISYYLESGLTSHATSNMYGVIGSVTNKGPGTTKSIYGRAIAASGCTGDIIASAFRTQLDTGSNAANSHCLQIGPAGDNTKILDSVFLIDTENPNFSAEYGILSQTSMEYTQAFIRACAGGGGDFLKWQASGGGATLFNVNDAGNIFTNTKLNIANSTELSDGLLTRSISSGNMVISAGNTGICYFGTGTDYPLFIQGSTINIHNNSGARLNFTGSGSSTVGASGAASALPALPLGYTYIKVNGNDAKVAYYNP